MPKDEAGTRESGEMPAQRTFRHAVNGGEKVGHVAAQSQASGWVPSAMARALVT